MYIKIESFVEKPTKIVSMSISLPKSAWGLGVSQPPPPRLRRLYISIWLEIGHDLPLLHMTISNKAKLLAYLGC